MSRHRNPGLPRDPLIQIEITLTLPQIIWLLAGLAIDNLHAFGKLAEKVGHVLPALTG